MKFDDAELKRLLQEGMEYEADCIIAEVESDPNMQDVVAPEAIFDNLLKQIREREDEMEKQKETLSQEEQELIRLGKIYKKKRGRRKYIVLIAAIVCAFGVGTISLGDGKKMFTEIKGLFGKTSHTRVSDGDDEKFDGDTIASEEDAYDQIEEKFGFWPVRMYYLPDGMEFSEVVIEEASQNVRIFYENEKGKSIIYRIITDYRTASVSTDIEDIFVREYEKTLNEINISIKEYEIEEDKSSRWSVEFVYKDSQYTIILTDIKQDEVEKIIENLYFS